MFYFITAYIVSALITILFIEKFKYKHFPFPKLKITKLGVEFFSTENHRINIGYNKIFVTDEKVYLKTKNQIIVFANIKNVVCKNEHMYFTACGLVKIGFHCGNLYKYFNLMIKSKSFNFEDLKQTAIVDLMNNQFDICKSKKFNKFLNFIKNTLKIQINNEKVLIFSNNLKLSYQLTYKMNNKIKKINVVNSIGKN